MIGPILQASPFSKLASLKGCSYLLLSLPACLPGPLPPSAPLCLFRWLSLLLLLTLLPFFRSFAGLVFLLAYFAFVVAHFINIFICSAREREGERGRGSEKGSGSGRASHCTLLIFFSFLLFIAIWVSMHFCVCFTLVFVSLQSARASSSRSLVPPTALTRPAPRPQHCCALLQLLEVFIIIVVDGLFLLLFFVLFISLGLGDFPGWKQCRESGLFSMI